MLNRKHDHVPRSASAEPSMNSTDTTTFANEVAAEYDKLETGYLAGLYRFFGKALTSYRKYRKDTAAYEELLELDYIASLREKPGVMETSRLVLYKLTTARTGERRNAAGRYARVVDYLFQHGVKSSDAAKYVEDAGGMDAILRLARGHAAPKDADDDEIVQDEQEEGQEGDEEEGQAEETDPNGMIEADPTNIFDPDKDLSIRMADEARLRILSDDVPLKERFFLECTKVFVDKQGHSRIVGKLWKPSPE